MRFKARLTLLASFTLLIWAYLNIGVEGESESDSSSQLQYCISRSIGLPLMALLAAPMIGIEPDRMGVLEAVKQENIVSFQPNSCFSRAIETFEGNAWDGSSADAFYRSALIDIRYQPDIGDQSFPDRFCLPDIANPFQAIQLSYHAYRRHQVLVLSYMHEVILKMRSANEISAFVGRCRHFFKGYEGFGPFVLEPSGALDYFLAKMLEHSNRIQVDIWVLLKDFIGDGLKNTAVGVGGLEQAMRQVVNLISVQPLVNIGAFLENLFGIQSGLVVAKPNPNTVFSSGRPSPKRHQGTMNSRRAGF